MKTALTILLFFLIITTSNAQNLSFGAIAGIGNSKIKFGDNPYNDKSRLSYNVGLRFAYSLIDKLGLGFDIKYSAEGGKVTGTDVSTNHEFEYGLNYIRLPVQAIFFLSKPANPFQPKIALGPSFGFLIGGKTTHDIDGSRVSSGTSKDIFDGFDMGLNGTLGLNYRVSAGAWLNADIIYYYGLTDSNSADPALAKNRNLTFNLGMTFTIKQ